MKKLTEPRTRRDLERIKKLIEQKFNHRYIQKEIYRIFETGYRILPDPRSIFDSFCTLAGSWEIWNSTPIGFYIRDRERNEHIRFGKEKPVLWWQLRPRENYDYLALSSKPEQDKEQYPAGYPHLTLDFRISKDGPYKSFDFIDHGCLSSITQDIGYSLENSVCVSPSAPLTQRFFSKFIEPHCQKGCFTGNRLMMEEYARLAWTCTAINIAIMYIHGKSN